MNPEELGELIQAHEQHVRFLALQIWRGLPSYVDLDELVSCGLIALVQKAQRYQPERGVRFWDFASKGVRGGIYDSIRRKNFKYATHASLSGIREPLTKESTDDGARYADLMRTLDRATARLKPRERKLLTLIYERGHTHRDAGRMLGMSEALTSNIHTQAMRKLRESRFAPILRSFTTMKAAAEKQAEKQEERRQIAAEVDELGALSQKLQPFRDSIKREEELKKGLRERAAQDPGEEEVLYVGQKFSVTLSPKQKERSIVEGGVEKIYKWLKPAEFFRHCKIALKVLEVVLTEEQRAEVIREERSGYRKIEIEPLKSQTARKAA